MDLITEFDRPVLAMFNGSESLFLDNLVVILTSGLTWIPLYISLLYVVIKNNDSMRQIALVIGCVILCVLLTGGLDEFVVKPMVARQRPSYDPVLKYSIAIVNDYRASGYSFFSAHAANTFCIATFFSRLVRDKRFVIVMVSWSLLNCWTRLYLGVHYPSDILVGLAWGAIVGFSVYYIYVKVVPARRRSIDYGSSHHSSTGYNRADVDVVLLVLTLVLLYSIIRALAF